MRTKILDHVPRLPGGSPWTCRSRVSLSVQCSRRTVVGVCLSLPTVLPTREQPRVAVAFATNGCFHNDVAASDLGTIDLREPVFCQCRRSPMIELVSTHLHRSVDGQGNFLGRVRYLHQRDALDYVAGEVQRFGPGAFSSPQGHAEAVLIKREGFSHEQEVRLLRVGDPLGQRIPSPHIQVDIDPNVVFRRLTLDPRLVVDDRVRRIEEIRGLGYTRPVDMSKLYLPVTIQVQTE
jgi:hypothetical protein